MLVGWVAWQGWQCIAIDDTGIRYGQGNLDDGAPIWDSCWESGSEGYWAFPPVDQAQLDALAINWGG